MPEYMDYNDFGEEKTKRQKVFSAIGLTLSILWLVVVVLWVIFKTPDNIRSDFAAISSSSHSFSEKADTSKNQFLMLKNELESGKKFTISTDFRQTYPDVYKLLIMSELDISKNVPKAFDQDGYFTLALTYVISSHEDEDGIVRADKGIDFLMIPYESTDKNGLCVTLNQPLKFSLRYNAEADGVVPRVVNEPVSPKRFRLGFYSLSVDFKTKDTIENIGYKARLLHPLTKSESKNLKFSKNISVKGFEKLKSSLISGEGVSDTVVERTYALPEPFKNTATLVINYDDLMYNKMDSITFTVPDMPSGEFVITIN